MVTHWEIVPLAWPLEPTAEVKDAKTHGFGVRLCALQARFWNLRQKQHCKLLPSQSFGRRKWVCLKIGHPIKTTMKIHVNPPILDKPSDLPVRVHRFDPILHPPSWVTGPTFFRRSPKRKDEERQMIGGQKTPSEKTCNGNQWNLKIRPPLEWQYLLPKLHPRWDFSTLNDIPQTSQDDAGCEIQLRMWWKYLGVFFSIRIYSSNGVRIQAATIPSTIRHRWWGRLVRLPSFARPTGIRLQNDYSPRKEKKHIPDRKKMKPDTCEQILLSGFLGGAGIWYPHHGSVLQIASFKRVRWNLNGLTYKPICPVIDSKILIFGCLHTYIYIYMWRFP